LEEEMERYVGIDIGKASYHVAVVEGESVQQGEFANRASGHKKLLKWLKQSPEQPVSVCLEATGRYWESVAYFLHEAGLKVHVVNPAQVKAFRDSKLQRNKNDKVDAFLLAHFCRLMQPHEWHPPTPAVRELQALIHHYDSLVEERTRVANRLQALNPSAFVHTQLQHQYDFLQSQMDALWHQIRDHIRHDPDLKRNLALLDSIPGIAENTAAHLLAEIGDAAHFASADQLAAYLGVCPANFTSGSSVHAHPRMSKRGNARLRKALFWPAISAITHNPRIIPLAERLRAKGKSNMEIIGAAMHKLARLVFGVLHSQLPFYPLPP
jgi:transposase